MNYEKKIEDAQTKAYGKVIATKILDLMTNMRLSNDENIKRRWIWELLQNAKDVCFAGKQVSIEIVLSQQNENGTGTLEFKHNGKSFSIEDVTFLIEQISTKDRPEKGNTPPKTTGKFGTGFLTTHLLSEKVEVQGIVEEPELKPRKFSLLLDRSGKTIDEIISSVHKSMESLRRLDSSPIAKYKQNDFNTIFCYHLDKDGFEVAEKGIKDLHSALPFTLAFLPTVESVVIKSNGETMSYRRSENIENINDKIKLISIETSLSKRLIITLSSSRSTSIAIEVEKQNQQISVRPFEHNSPHLFCDFPLIGTEDFYLPVIVNNSSFYLNEPRNGIYLTDKETNEISANKSLMQEAVELYFHLLEYASQNNWQNLYVLSSVSIPKSKKDWLSEKWFKDYVQKPIQEKLKITPVVDTVIHGRVTLNEALFPYHINNEIRKGIWELSRNAGIFKLPIEKHLDNWFSVVRQLGLSSGRLTLEAISGWINTQKTLTNLAKVLKRNEENAIDWLNQYYSLINRDENTLVLINQDKSAVIPNQKGVFCYKSKLSVDKGIEEELKNALELLEEDWWSSLILADIDTGEGIKCSVKSQNDIIQRINQLLDEKGGEEISEACDYLISCFAEDTDFPAKREVIYDLCQTIFSNIPEKRQIKTWDDNIWKKVDKFQVNWLAYSVEEQENVQGLSQYLEWDEKETLEWLNELIHFLEEEKYGDMLNEYAVLPNQNGQFTVKEDLYLDGEINDKLKDIAADLGGDFRNELLHKDIFLTPGKHRTKTSEDVSKEIRKLIEPKFSETPRTEETKRILKKLFSWFVANSEESEKLFGDFYSTSKYRLLDDEEIASQMEEIPILIEENQKLKLENEQLHDEKSIAEEEIQRLKLEIKQLEAEKTSKKSIVESEQEITVELLLTHAIDSEAKLDFFLKENSHFVPLDGHKGGKGFSMIMHVKGIIERAKRNVKDYLARQPDYDCGGWYERETVIHGVKKYGHQICLVVRPSDGDKVIFHKDSERNTLKLQNSELWVENGKTQPREITLGTVLNRMGIRQINL